MSAKVITKMILLNCFIWTARIMDFVFPKNKKLVVLDTHHPGNTTALYKYLKNNDCGLEAHCINIKEIKNLNEPPKRKFLIILKLFFILLYAKTIITTHGTIFKLSKRKLYVETWHGVPLKGQIYTEVNPNPKHLSASFLKFWKKYLDVFIAPSKEAAYRMCASCNINAKKIEYCGQARNDILYTQRKNVQLVKKLLRAPECSRLILYCPTFRENKNNVNLPLFPFCDTDQNTLERFLLEMDALLLLRNHIYAKNNYIYKNDLDRIVNVNQDKWQDVNELLPHIDILITDYSSVYYDFLILDRPIIFLPYDIDSYQSTRGFVVDDFDWWTPGQKVYSFEELLKSIRSAIKNPLEDSSHRKTINALINFYQDSNASYKNIKIIKKRLGLTI